MYYRLTIEPSLTSGHIQLDAKFKLFKLFLLRGSRIDEKTLPSPWTFTVQPNPRHELSLNDYYPEFHLMSRRLVGILQAAGVSNLQVFPAVIRNIETDETYEDFLVVNIVGLVSCANAAQSDSADVADKKYFYRLVIDTAKVNGLTMFRLEESRLDVIVNEQVAEGLRTGGLRNLGLEVVAA